SARGGGGCRAPRCSRAARRRAPAGPLPAPAPAPARRAARPPCGSRFRRHARVRPPPGARPWRGTARRRCGARVPVSPVDSWEGVLRQVFVLPQFAAISRPVKDFAIGVVGPMPASGRQEHVTEAGNRRGRRRFMAGTALAVAVLAVGIVPATAAGIVRDAETEALIQDYARPIFKAAGIRATGVKILVVNDDSFNAFVSSADRMFVNTGAIIRAETPNELIGVIAHETGHLAHGDLGSIRQRVQSTQNSVLA